MCLVQKRRGSPVDAMESELWDYTGGCCSFLNHQPVTASLSSFSSKPCVNLLPGCFYPHPYVAIPIFSLNFPPFSSNPGITSSKELLRDLADGAPNPLKKCSSQVKFLMTGKKEKYNPHFQKWESERSGELQTSQAPKVPVRYPSTTSVCLRKFCVASSALQCSAPPIALDDLPSVHSHAKHWCRTQDPCTGFSPSQAQWAELKTEFDTKDLP